MSIKKILIFIIVTIIFMNSNIFATTSIAPLEEKSQEELLHDAIITFLDSAIVDGIANCYKDILKGPPNYSIQAADIIKVDRFYDSDGGITYYTIEVEVEPYIAAHNSVGKDRILIKIEHSEPPTLIRCLHLLDYKLPKEFNNYYLNDQAC